jgi:hypothetical protein
VPVTTIFFYTGNPIFFSGFNIDVIGISAMVFLKSLVIEIYRLLGFGAFYFRNPSRPVIVKPGFNSI